MRRIGWARCLLAIGCLTGVFAVDGADEPTRAEKREAAEVDRILGEWQKRMASVTSLEAKFRKSTASNGWGERKSVGRIVLAAPNLAMVEATTVDAEGRPTSDKSKSIWNGEHFLTFDYEREQVIRFRRRGDRSSLPVPLCVPFLFQLSAGRAGELFDWMSLGERGDRVFVGATSRNDGAATPGPTRYIIELEKASWLPRKVIVQGRERERETYEWHDVKLNAPVEEEWKDPCLDAWKVVEPFDWLTRWLPR